MGAQQSSHGGASGGKRVPQSCSSLTLKPDGVCVVCKVKLTAENSSSRQRNAIKRSKQRCAECVKSTSECYICFSFVADPSRCEKCGSVSTSSSQNDQTGSLWMFSPFDRINDEHFAMYTAYVPLQQLFELKRLSRSMRTSISRCLEHRNVVNTCDFEPQMTDTIFVDLTPMNIFRSLTTCRLSLDQPNLRRHTHRLLFRMILENCPKLEVISWTNGTIDLDRMSDVIGPFTRMKRIDVPLVCTPDSATIFANSFPNLTYLSFAHNINSRPLVVDGMVALLESFNSIAEVKIGMTPKFAPIALVPDSVLVALLNNKSLTSLDLNAHVPSTGISILSDRLPGSSLRSLKTGFSPTLVQDATANQTNSFLKACGNLSSITLSNVIRLQYAVNIGFPSLKRLRITARLPHLSTNFPWESSFPVLEFLELATKEESVTDVEYALQYFSPHVKMPNIRGVKLKTDCKTAVAYLASIDAKLERVSIYVCKPNSEHEIGSFAIQNLHELSILNGSNSKIMAACGALVMPVAHGLVVETRITRLSINIVHEVDLQRMLEYSWPHLKVLNFRGALHLVSADLCAHIPSAAPGLRSLTIKGDVSFPILKALFAPGKTFEFLEIFVTSVKTVKTKLASINTVIYNKTVVQKDMAVKSLWDISE
eukprot:816640_1